MSEPVSRPRVAAIVTEYRPRSHADVLVTKLLEGYELFWTPIQPHVDIVSLYTDQVPANDISRELAARHNLPIYPTIREAITGGGADLAVDAVLLVGEHGDYPLNEKGQKLYPRRRFFEETVATFKAAGRVVPVFSDKHLAWNWPDAKWIYDTAREMGIPFMAGSSMPIAFRCPPVEMPLDADIEEIVCVGHGPLESYGYHILECGQCLMERRAGGETGVASVQCLYGDAFWEAFERGGLWSRELQEAAIEVTAHEAGDPHAWFDAHNQAIRERDARPPKGTPPAQVYNGEEKAFLVEYRDGLRMTVLMVGGYVPQRAAAVKIRGWKKPLAMSFIQGRGRTVSNFSHLSFMVEEFFRTGRPPYPVERTLLTSGMIDAVMTSHYEDGRRVDTPYLDVAYQAPQGGASFAPRGTPGATTIVEASR
jgi:hypothetical protein